MFGFQVYLAGPTTWVRLARDGRAVREGVGLWIWRFRPGSSLVAVPLELRETEFRLYLSESDPLTGQGSLVWRIADPETAAARLDFRVDRNGDAAGDGLDRIESMLAAERRAAFRAVAGRSDEAPSPTALAAEAFAALRASSLLAALGVEVLAVHVENLILVKPDGIPVTPERDPGPWTGVTPSSPLAEPWRRDLPLYVKMGPRFGRGIA